MSSKEYNQYIEDLKKLQAKLLSSKSASSSFYQDAGIHTKSGKLTSAYVSHTHPQREKSLNK